MANFNPYAAPNPHSAPEPTGLEGLGEPREFGVGEVISRGYELFKDNFGILVGSLVLSQVLQHGFNFLAGVILGVLQNADVVAAKTLAATSIQLAFQVIGFFLACFFSVGSTRIHLAVARGRSASIGMLFSGADRMVSMLVAMLVAGLAIVGGILCLIVPGIIISIGLSLYAYFVVDRELGGVEAVRASWRATKGHKGKIFTFMLASLGVVIAGALACGVGLLVAVPVVSMAWTLVYLRITGQPLGDEAVFTPPSYAPMPDAPLVGYGAAPR